jgi:hypothetical protein
MSFTGRIPHNRKWPIYTMPVGDSFTVEQPPKRLRPNLHRRAGLHGIVLSFRQLRPGEPGFTVTRRA